MLAVGVVQVAVYQVVDVISVRDDLVAAIGPVPMAFVVGAALMLRGARGWVRRAHFQPALVGVVTVRPMQMAFVEVIEVIAMLERSVSAARAMNVVVVIVVNSVGHRSSSAGALASVRRVRQGQIPKPCAQIPVLGRPSLTRADTW
jgi:hypothetical protein